MCFLCDHDRDSQRVVAAEINDGLALYGLSIAPTELIDRRSVAVTQQSTATDHVLEYYMHTPGGAVSVSGGGLGFQTIQSLAIPVVDQNYFRAMVQRLDTIIDLDFRQVGTASRADVDIFYDTDINLGDSGVTLGLAASTGFDGWEVFVNYPEIQNDENYRRYVLIHEFGHTLGLEHPFEARDGDVFNGITDPWASAYPEDTVMAYRAPIGDRWPEFFTDNDINALINVWGAETQLFSTNSDMINGSSYRDILLGAGGNDILRGRNRGDRLEGGRGDDQVMGGPGPDELFGGSGSDQLFGGFGHDTINGGSGEDRIRGGFGSDLFILSRGDDIVEDFRISDHDRLGLRSGIGYELIQEDRHLLVSTELGVTSILDVNLSQFMNNGQIVFI